MFSSTENAPGDIDQWALFSARPDGTDKRLLLSNGRWNIDAVFSPDGSRLAFVSEKGSQVGSHIFVMRADGSDIRQLTSGANINTSPTWTPDGQRIVFSSNRDGEFTQKIFVMNPDGTAVTALSTVTDFQYDQFPSVSPNGRQIALYSLRVAGPTVTRCLYLMPITGGSATLIPNTCDLRGAPEWSPDGSRLLIAEPVPGGGEGQRLITMRPTGEDRVALTSGVGVFDGAASWSPDGSRIIFVRSLPSLERLGIFTIAAGGGDERTIVPVQPRTGVFVTTPTWGR